ncbi:MAG: hypothetical protein ACK4NU_00800 [Brevundimonas sp.]
MPTPTKPNAPFSGTAAKLLKRGRKALARATFRLRTNGKPALAPKAVAVAALAAIEQGDGPALAHALREIEALGQMNGHVAGLLLHALSRHRRAPLAHLLGPRIAQCMTAPRWAPKLEAALLALDDRDLAQALRTTGIDDGDRNTGALALDACLCVAARIPLLERLSILDRLERLAPQLCKERPVRAAARALPQPRGAALDIKDVRAALNRAGAKVLVVAGPDLDIADLAVLPESSAITLTAYRPIQTVLEGWRQNIAAMGASDRIQIIDNLQHDSDLNDAFHLRLSQAADQLAKVVMDTPEVAADPYLRTFQSQHGEAGAIKLSDRLFAWMRVQAAFVQVLRMTQPTLVIMFDVGNEALRAVSASVAPTASLLAVRAGRSLRSVERADSTATSDGPFTLRADALLAQIIDQGRSTGTAARSMWTAQARGALFVVRSSLHTPLAQRLAKTLGASAVDLSELLVQFVETRRPLACNLPPAQVLKWMEQAEINETAAELALNASTVSEHFAIIIRRFLEVDLVRLMQIDAVTASAIKACDPRFAVILPTRHPELRIAAGNCRFHGTKVHEIQAVYLSEMPRYRTPLVDRYHALDTFSVQQLQDIFGLPASAIRAGGSLRPLSVQRANARSPDAPFRLTLATQPEPIAKSLLRLSETAAALRSVRTPWSLTLRPHPAEGQLRLDSYRAAFEEAGLEARFGGDLARTDLLVTGFSNLVMEAAVAEIRVATHLPRGPSPVPYDVMGLAHRTSNPAALAAFIEDCAGDGPLSTNLDFSRRRYLEQNPLLGRPADAAVAIAADILDGLKA